MNDIGGLIGTMSVGIISDMTYQKRSPVTIVGAFGACVIFFYLTATYDSLDYGKLMVNFFFYGLFMQGVTNTIASTCSADIGKNIKSKNVNAVSTVTGIIDGMGTIGASIGQFTVGATVTSFGWQYGYLGVVTIIQFITFCVMARIFCQEISEIIQIRKDLRKKTDDKLIEPGNEERTPSAGPVKGLASSDSQLAFK